MNYSITNAGFIEKLYDVKNRLDKNEYQLYWNEKSISDESIKEYSALIEKILLGIEKSENVNQILETVDNELKNMCIYFDDALKRGFENTAGQMLSSIIESVNCIGRAVISDDQKEELAKRQKSVRSLEMLVQFQDFHDETELKILKLNKRIAELEQKVKEAQEAYRELEPMEKYYQALLGNVLAGRAEVSEDLMNFVNTSDRLNKVKNSYRKYCKMVEILEKNNNVVGESIRNISLIAFGTPEILGESTVEGLKQTINDFEDSIIAQKKEIAQLKDMNTHISSILEEAASDLEDYEPVKIDDPERDAAIQMRLKRREANSESWY